VSAEQRNEEAASGRLPFFGFDFETRTVIIIACARWKSGKPAFGFSTLPSGASWGGGNVRISPRARGRGLSPLTMACPDQCTEWQIGAAGMVVPAPLPYPGTSGSGGSFARCSTPLPSPRRHGSARVLSCYTLVLPKCAPPRRRLPPVGSPQIRSSGSTEGTPVFCS
jgi:hypothetical protein